MSSESLVDVLFPEDNDDKDKGGGYDPCTVCLENLFDDQDTAVRIYKCGHRFHYKCVQENLSHCPNCRGKTALLCGKCFAPIDTAYVIGTRAYTMCPACIMSKLKFQLSKRKTTIYRIQKSIVQLQASVGRYRESVDQGHCSKDEGYTMITSELSQFFAFFDHMFAENC